MLRFVPVTVVTVLFISQIIVGFILLSDVSQIEVLAYVGVGLYVLSGLVFGWLPVIEFRKRECVKSGESYIHTTQLVDTGIFSIVRHHQYVIFILLAIAGMLLFQHWIVILLGIPIVPLTYIDLIKADKDAIEKFGDDYELYMKKVPRANFFLGIIRRLIEIKNKMKHRSFLIILFCSLLFFALVLFHSFNVKDPPKGEHDEVYIGIDAAYYDIAEIEGFVDEISNYTNLFVIGCTGITYNTTQLYETCQHVYEEGFSFIVYSDMPPLMEWFVCCYVDCVNEWDEKFLGLYAFDEGCGRQLDLKTPRPFSVDEAKNYTDAGDQFVNSATERLNWYKQGFNTSMNFPLYTSDYALYWFDYKAGYDVVLAEFGWNYSRQLNIALCRGAATVHNKDWGIMLTWTYNEPPYIESGEELYDDMVLAYKNGAKYIVLFDTNEEYTHGVLEKEHLNALKRFWQYTQDNPRTKTVKNGSVAYVLPRNYGYGFRGPNDKIWGLWTANDFSLEQCTNIDSLLEQYGTKLDVIYDDGLNSSNTSTYSKLIFWNGTISEG